MKELSAQGRRLLTLLVSHLPNVNLTSFETFLGYKKVHELLGLERLREKWGDSLKVQGLEDLALWTAANGLPAISGLVIDTTEKWPGSGYFEVYKRPKLDGTWWFDQIRKAVEFDWSTYIREKTERAPSEHENEPLLRNVWRLVAHHEKPEAAYEHMRQRKRVAIGWSHIGNLRERVWSGPKEIGTAIRRVYSDIQNTGHGGQSLWNLLHVNIGDLIIVSVNGKRECVMEAVGNYFFAREADWLLGYAHQLPAVVTDIDADKLWEECGSRFADGQGSRWTLAACGSSPQVDRTVYREGKKLSVMQTSYERDPEARAACLRVFGAICQVCDLDFEKMYGPIGRGFIHVHHRYDISLWEGEYQPDPANDLVPLCPNCHAMVHRQRPAMEVEDLVKIVESRNNKRGQHS